MFHGYHRLTEKPWHTIGLMKFSIYPFFVGLTYFVPLDLSFSIWFFYVFFKAQQVVAYISSPSVGIFTNGVYGNEQGLGAWTTIGIVLLWMGRKHLGQVWNNITGKQSSVDDTAEPMRHRSALLGLALSVIFLVAPAESGGIVDFSSSPISWYIPTHVDRHHARPGSTWSTLSRNCVHKSTGIDGEPIGYTRDRSQQSHDTLFHVPIQ